MNPDDKVCYCYNVSQRKLWNYARRNPLRRASQMSECLGAGTGCGWCIPLLKRIFEEAQSETVGDLILDIDAKEYAERRKVYIRDQAPKNKF